RADANDKSAILDSILSSDSSKKDALQLPNGGAKSPLTVDIINAKEQFVTMDGQIVFKNAVKPMASHCATLIERNNLTLDGIDWFIPHQANLRIIEAVAHLMKYPM